MKDIDFVRMTELIPGTHWEGNKMVDNENGVYNCWFLQRCDIHNIPSRVDGSGWKTVPGIYFDEREAYDARLKKMQEDPDHYYMMMWANMKNYGKAV